MEKRETMEETELPNQKRIRTLGVKKKEKKKRKKYKYLGVLEADTIKQSEMKEKVRKEYLRRTKKLFKIKLCSRNLIKGLNTWVVILIRYSGPFLRWTREELWLIDQRKRILMMIMHKCHADNGEKRNNGRNRITKSEKNQITWGEKKRRKKKGKNTNTWEY